MKFPFFKSALRRAIERGLAEGGDLRREIYELGDLKVKSRGDAEDICWGLQRFAGGGDAELLTQRVSALTGLFQEVDGREADAFVTLQEKGTPELIRLFDLTSQVEPASSLSSAPMFILKILALYGTTEGTLKIVEAAQKPFDPDGYMWTVIFQNFTAGHPEADLFFKSLSEPLPKGFMGVSLLDASNAYANASEDHTFQHPFDSAEGKKRLREFLTNPEPGKFSYAHSSTAALPFVSNPERDELLNLAMTHPDSGVRIEAAWAAAKLGRNEGFSRLAEFCRDYKTASSAMRYLRELGREDVMPSEAKELSFQALAEFCQWLAHPNELAQIPDELEIVDHRELSWPPDRELKPFWLIKYVKRDRTGLEDDDTGCGLVGSVMFCFFSYKAHERPPEDAYALHCCWEMEQHGLIEISEIEGDQNEYASLIQQWKGPKAESVSVVSAAEISPDLKYAQRLVAVATASVKGEEGWIVLDGNRSEFYPKTQQPEGESANLVLKIHLGRGLLGFTGKPDRSKWLARPTRQRPAEQVIAGYEQLLDAAAKSKPEKPKDQYKFFGPLGNHLQEYAQALQASGRATDVRDVLQRFAPHWEHAAGYGALGKAAYVSGQEDLAEQFFIKYRNEYADFDRGEEMSLLAKIWSEAGKLNEARDLLIECLQKILRDSQSATGSDVQLFEEWFQQRKATLVDLFPAEWESLLRSANLPGTTTSGVGKML